MAPSVAQGRWWRPRQAAGPSFPAQAWLGPVSGSAGTAGRCCPTPCGRTGPRRRTLQAGSGQTGRCVDPAGRVRTDKAAHLPKGVARVPRARALTRARLGPTPQERNGSPEAPALQSSGRGQAVWAAPRLPAGRARSPRARSTARGPVPRRWAGRPPPRMPPPAGARG